MDISEEDYQKAVAVVRKCLSGSVSNLQRKLYWGYGRAASAIDRMQDEFIVSPMSASGRRDVYPEETHELWKELQAAKAQAVPEGFVLIKASDRDQEMLELIDQRDHMESQAEELKDKLQALYGVDFGEHSSCNFPFQNAIDYDDSDLVLVPREMPKSFDEGLYVYSNSISIVDECSEGFIPMSDINHAEVWKLVIEVQEQK